MHHFDVEAGASPFWKNSPSFDYMEVTKDMTNLLRVLIDDGLARKSF
jgi:hypothetical protein